MDENIDFSKAFEKVQEMLSDENGQEQIQNILSMLTGEQSSDDASSGSPENNLPALLAENLFSGSDNAKSPDMDMFFKLQKIMSLMKNYKNTPQTDFLHSLKPFLKSERRNKVEQAVKLINAVNVIKIFKSMEKGGD